MAYLKFTEPNVCVGENIVIENGRPRLAKWAVPRLVVDVRADSGGDGKVYQTLTLPGKLLINRKISWRNDTPLDQDIVIRVTRGPRSWITSNPNAVQIRDRWTTAVNKTPDEPVTTGIFQSQVGSAIDLGTDSLATPNPGVQYIWEECSTLDDWWDRGPLAPGDTFNLWYQCYVWTPPPWSNNANRNTPKHEGYVDWTRLSLLAYGRQGTLVTG